MNKSELTAAVMEACPDDFASKAAAGRVVNAVFDAVKNEVASGGSVGIVGFGTFTSTERAEREGKNPQTGETITIPAKTVPVFKPGQEFKCMVNR